MTDTSQSSSISEPSPSPSTARRIAAFVVVRASLQQNEKYLSSLIRNHAELVDVLLQLPEVQQEIVRFQDQQEAISSESELVALAMELIERTALAIEQAATLKPAVDQAVLALVELILGWAGSKRSLGNAEGKLWDFFTDTFLSNHPVYTERNYDPDDVARAIDFLPEELEEYSESARNSPKDFRGANFGLFAEAEASSYNYDIAIYNYDIAIRQSSNSMSEFTDTSDSQPDRPCHIYAEMDDRVIINRVTTLEVIVSSSKLEWQYSSTAQGGEVSVDPNKKLIVQVIPKTNFIVLEGDRVEVAPPAPGWRHQLYFDLRPTHLGEGEVWVVVRQGQVSLLTLSLQPEIVENRAQLRDLSAQPLLMSSLPDTPAATKIRSNGSITKFPTLSEPLHQLRIVEQRNGNQITYRYELDSPELQIFRDFESKPILGERQKYIENLYKEIESHWSSSQDDVESFTAELRAFGGKLFDELFPEGLQALLWQYYSQLQSIMVISTEPFIPWELVHLKQPGQTYLPAETKFLGQMGLVRWLFGTFPPQTMQIRKGRSHYVIPQYPDNRYRLPQAEQESKFLEQTFQATAIEPQPTPVRKLLESGNFDLLHFAGHGVAEEGDIASAKLMLQGRIEGTRYVLAHLNATTVEQYCMNASDNHPMVILNACQIGREGYTLTGIGGFAQAFLKGGAGVFVGTLWSVGDRPARMFTETFYTGLTEGLNLAEATINARESARQAGDATWLAYVVYGHPHLKISATD